MNITFLFCTKLKHGPQNLFQLTGLANNSKLITLKAAVVLEPLIPLLSEDITTINPLTRRGYLLSRPYWAI